MDLGNCKLIESCRYRTRQGISNSPESISSPKVKRHYKSGGIPTEKSKINDSRLAWYEKKSSNPRLQKQTLIHLEISSRRYFIKKLTPLELKSAFKPLEKVYNHLINADSDYPQSNYFRPNSLTPLTVNNKKFYIKKDKFSDIKLLKISKNKSRYGKFLL